MLSITRKDGATFTDAQDSLRKLWEDHYIVWSFSDDEEEDYSEVPGEYYATYFSIQIADGKIEIAGWHEAEPCLPFELRPEEYTITLS